jgi:hypothetical protein
MEATMNTKKPSKALLERAVKATQLYCGATGMHVRYAQKLYKRMFNATARVADTSGMSYGDVASQITAEAKKRGCLSPLPGKDY